MKKAILLIFLFVVCNLCVSAQEKPLQDFSGVQIESSLGKNLTIEFQSCVGNKFAQAVHIRLLLAQNFAHQVIKIETASAFDANGNKYKLIPYGGKGKKADHYILANSHPRKIPFNVEQILSSVSRFETLELEVLFTNPYQAETIIIKNVPILWK